MTLTDELLNDEEIAALAGRELDATELNSDTDLKATRLRAMEYAYGNMSDTPSKTGRSKAMLRTVRDTIGWVLPSIMRVFFSSDEIAAVAPRGPEDEEAALQQQDGLNYAFLNQCAGYRHLYNAWHDALLLRTGVVKFWWQVTTKRSVEKATGLDEASLAVLMADNEGIEIISVVEHTGQADTGLMDEQNFEPVPLRLFDVTYRRDVTEGKIELAAVPPEEYRIDGAARSLEEARFAAHVCHVRRGDLVAQGFDREIVGELPKIAWRDFSGLRSERERNQFSGISLSDSQSADHSAEYVEKAECYMLVDRDGDGMPEWNQIVLGGGTSGSRRLLSIKPWTDPIPFVEFTPDIVPHRREGLSIADHTMDMQQIGTVLLRAALDNTYAQGNRQKVVIENEVLNMDEVVEPSFDGVIRVKSNPQAVTELQQGFIAGELWQAMQGLDEIVEKRTGVSRQTMALDPQALQNQTATAANISQSASYSRIELIARNFAERLEVLLRGINRLMATHQDKPNQIRLRGKWTSIDPRAWNADADISINTGIGFGNREREMAMLQTVLALQKEIVANFGPENPVVPPSKVLNTASQIVRAAGLRSPDRYFNDVPDQVLMQLLAEQKKGQTNPEIEKANIAAQASVASAKIKVEADIEIARLKMANEMQLRQIEMQHEADLKTAAIMSGTNLPGDETNIRRIA